MDLDAIRARDRSVVPRIGDPDRDPLLRAEMDRRDLLAEVERLNEKVRAAQSAARRDEASKGRLWEHLRNRAGAAEATIFHIREWLDADLRCDECPEDDCVHVKTVRDYESTLRDLVEPR